MDNEKMGQFISKLRKSHKMTQKELAAKLNVTDKAVSKWERGLSCPDISLLSPIASILGVTTNELLNGEKSDIDIVSNEENIDNVLKYADKAVKRKTNSIQNICAIIFSIIILISILICIICDVTISGTFTWSLIPISSIVFSWAIIFPIIKYGKKGVVRSLIVLSILILPFLYVLNSIIETNDLIFLIGIRMYIISIIYIWIIFGLFKFLRLRKLTICAISLLFIIPTYVLINFMLSKIINEPLIDIWDILVLIIVILIVAILIVIDFITAKKQNLTIKE